MCCVVGIMSANDAGQSRADGGLRNMKRTDSPRQVKPAGLPEKCD